MLSKYRITVTNMETGEEACKPVECDGMMIVGLVGEREKYHAVRVRYSGVNENDMINAMYSEPKLKRAACRMAELVKWQYKGWLWKMFHREKGA